jgi:hypothetical protein
MKAGNGETAIAAFDNLIGEFPIDAGLDGRRPRRSQSASWSVCCSATSRSLSEKSSADKLECRMMP